MRAALCAGALLLATLAVSAAAEDISAGTMGAVSDLLSSVSADSPPPGVDADTYRKAVEALKKEGLAGVARPARPGDTALLQNYANALLLGPRAKDFRDQIGAVHDAVLSGSDDAIAVAIRKLYQDIGRAPPAEGAMPKLIADARTVGGDAPSETLNHSIERPGYRIDIVDAPAARDAAVEVVVQDGPGGKPARVVFEGTTRTGGKQGGEGLDRQLIPDAPCAMDAGTAAKLREKLNGEWNGSKGGAVTVGGSGESITISETNRAGRKLSYEGSFRLGKIDARHAITHPDDIDATLPAEVRRQLTSMGLFFTIRLETCRNPARLAGRWGSQHVTYNQFMQVDRVHDPYDKAYVLSRTAQAADYRIASLDISYAAWEAAQSTLRAKKAVAEDDLRRAEEQLRQENAAYEERRERTGQLYRAFLAAESARKAAEAAAANYVPPDAAKSEAYRKAEQKRARLARRVDVLYEGIVATSEGGSAVAPAAFENYDQLKSELDRLDAELARLDGELGFNAERERLRTAATEAFVGASRAETELNSAVAVQDQVRAREDNAEVQVSEARAKLSAAEQELARFTDTAVRISGVTSEDGAIMKYETVFWDPSEVLEFLNGEIADLGRVLQRASTIRRDTRAQFLDSQATASLLQDRLAESIMNSAYAQAGVESAFYLWDVVEKGMEAGPAGAIGEAGKKLVEAVILGPPSFHEPTMAPDILTGDGGPFADILHDVQGALKFAATRGFKTGVTGQAANVIVKKYIESRSTKVYMELIDQAIEGSMTTGYRIVGQSQAQKAVEAFDAMMQAREKFQKAVKEGAFPRFAALAGNSLKETLKNAAKDPKMRKLAASVGKDLAKAEIKEVVGEWVEGEALRAYMAADAEARLATQIFLAASGVYWESYDPYQARVEERREILRQYDPKNHMQIKRDERFPDGADLLIVFRDLEGVPLPATGQAMAVRLGGRAARQVAQDQFFFRVEARDLQHDGEGGVALEVSVER